jgi:acyltransferase
MTNAFQNRRHARRRDLRYAIVRGLGISLVFFGHNATPASLTTSVITSFLMPMFFLFSGVTFRSAAAQYGGREFAKYLLYTLVFPFFFFAFVSIPFFEISVLGGECQWPTFGCAIKTLLCGQFFANGSLWFLMSLCICKLLLWLLLRVQARVRPRALLWCAVAFVCITLQMKFAYRPWEANEHTPLSLPSIPSGFLFLSIGYALAPCYDQLRRIRFRWYESLSIAIVCLYVLVKFALSGHVCYMHAGFVRSMDVYATTVIGTVMLFMVANVLRTRRLRVLRQALVWFGGNSLILFALEDGVAGRLAKGCSYVLTGERRGWLATAIVFALLPLAYKTFAPLYKWLRGRTCPTSPGRQGRPRTKFLV